MSDSKPSPVENHQPALSDDQISDRALLENIYLSVEKTRKYIFWMNIITMAFVVLPILIALIATPFLIRGFGTYLNTLQLS